MDLSFYPNLNAIGLMPEKRLNRKMHENMMAHLEAIPPATLQQIDQEVPTAKTVMEGRYGRVLVTPTAIIKIGGGKKNCYIQDIVLCKDIIYIWGSTFTMRMYFIPYDKSHTMSFLTRNGSALVSEGVHTWGFSRKDILGTALREIQQEIDRYHPGILYGWTKDREEAMRANFQDLVSAVDYARNSGNTTE